MTDTRLEEMRIMMEDVQNFRKHRANLRRCTGEGSLKYKMKALNWYDDYKATVKWKRALLVKELKKKQREDKTKEKPSISGKRKTPVDYEDQLSSESFDQSKRQKAEEIKRGKRTMILSESLSGSEKEGNEDESEEASSVAKNDEGDNVVLDEVRAKLYKKL